MKFLKTIKSILGTSLVGIVLASCGPNLSTPENTIKTYLKAVKNSQDPLQIGGFTEEIDEAKIIYIGFYGSQQFHKEGHKDDNYCHDNIKCYQEKYGNYAKNCLPNLKKCITYSGVPKIVRGREGYEGKIHMVSVISEERTTDFFLQRENDGKWRICGIYTHPYN